VAEAEEQSLGMDKGQNRGHALKKGQVLEEPDLLAAGSKYWWMGLEALVVGD
jgi:hypothetical protein